MNWGGLSYNPFLTEAIIVIQEIRMDHFSREHVAAMLDDGGGYGKLKMAARSHYASMLRGIHGTEPRIRIHAEVTCLLPVDKVDGIPCCPHDETGNVVVIDLTEAQQRVASMAAICRRPARVW